jgi:hypothetical protein
MAGEPALGDRELYWTHIASAPATPPRHSHRRDCESVKLRSKIKDLDVA